MKPLIFALSLVGLLSCFTQKKVAKIQENSTIKLATVPVQELNRCDSMRLKFAQKIKYLPEKNKYQWQGRFIITDSMYICMLGIDTISFVKLIGKPNSIERKCLYIYDFEPNYDEVHRVDFYFQNGNLRSISAHGGGVDE